MAMDFIAASEQYVEIGDVAPLNITGSAITLSAWVKIASKAAEKKVLAKWSDSPAARSYLLSVGGGTDDKAIMAIANPGVASATGTTAMAIGTFHHILGTYDGSIIRVYLDGVEDDTTAKTGNIGSTTAPVRIGVGSGATSEGPTDGAIDDARIYDRVLSAKEVLTVFNSRGSDGITLGLAARYLMNEGAPSVVASGAGIIKDSGPNKLDGTPTNSPEWASGQLRFVKKRPLVS